MDRIEFKKLLFKVAFCTMACDGNIDDKEIEEMKVMDKHSHFFEDIDLSEELERIISELEQKGIKIIEELFEELKKNELNPIQELLILEVALRIIKADERYDENEIKFIHLLRGKLKVHDEIIKDRFGIVDILYENNYTNNIVIPDTGKELSQKIELPELTIVKNIDLKDDKK